MVEAGNVYGDTYIADQYPENFFLNNLLDGGYFPARVFDMMWPEKNARMANRALFDDGHVFGSHAYLRWIARDLMGFLV